MKKILHIISSPSGEASSNIWLIEKTVNQIFLPIME